MYNIIIENIDNKVSIEGKIIRNINSINYNEMCFSMNFNDKLFNYDILTVEEIENNKEITDIVFRYYSDEKINFKNLKYLPNLVNLCFYDLKTCYLPNEIFELTNIKELEITTTCIKFYNQQSKYYNINNLNYLDKLVNLERLYLDSDIKEFPKSILSLKKLKFLMIYSVQSLEIPNELCNLEDLINIKFNKYYPNILSNDDKMIVFNWKSSNNLIMSIANYAYFRDNNVDIKIPEKITNLKILNCEYNSLDNLPNNIEKLSLGTNIKFPLNNLPVTLNNLKIYKQNTYMNSSSIFDNVKLPFGCNLEIFF